MTYAALFNCQSGVTLYLNVSAFFKEFSLVGEIVPTHAGTDVGKILRGA